MVAQTQRKRKSLYFPLTVKEWSSMAKQLTHAQLKVLGYCRAACGPWGEREVEICIKDMAQQLGLDRSTVGRALKYIQQQGFINFEIVRVGIRITAAALKGYSNQDDVADAPCAPCDRSAQPCDRHAQPCDRHAQESDRTIASTIYKYDPTFNSQLAEEKNFADLSQYPGITAETLASLVNRLETLLKNNDPPQDQTSAAGHQGNIAAKGQGTVSATGHQGDVEAVGHKGAATAAGHQGDVEAVGHKGAATAAGHQGNVEAVGYKGETTATGHRGNIEATGHKDAAKATGHKGDVEATGHKGAATAIGHQGNVEAMNYQGMVEAVGHQGKITANGYGTVSAVGHCGTVVATSSSNQVQQEIWEIAPGQPFPVFWNWKEDKYKVQGGHWEANAASFSYSEFYKDRQRTTFGLWPQFLADANRVAEEANQSLAAGVDPVFPSWFAARRPLSLEASTQQLTANLDQLIEKGARVALPQGIATPSCNQSTSWEQATRSEVAPLSQLQQPAPVAIGPGGNFDVKAYFQMIAERNNQPGQQALSGG